MNITSIFGIIENFGKTVENTEGTIAKLNKSFDDFAGTTEATREQMKSTLNSYENITKSIEDSQSEIELLNEKLSGLSEASDEYKKTEKQRDAAKGKLEKQEFNKEKAQRKFAKTNGGKSIDAVLAKKKETDAAIASAKEGGSFTKSLKAFKATGVLAVASTVISIVEGAIKIATQYMVVGYENQLRALQAITTSSVNTMKANLGLWTDSLKGAYEAQNLSMSSNLAMIEAQNATDLANKKLSNMWTNWIPIWGTLNKYAEEEMRLEQQIQEMRLKNAQEIIQAGEGYAQRADEYGKKQDDAIRKYTRSVGLSAGQTRIFEKRALALNTSLADINATMEDALKIQMGMQEQSGRLIGFSNEDYLKSTAVGQIMGPENVTKFESEMVIFNKSVADSTSIMEDMYQYANTMGLSQKKLTQNVLNNLKLANKYQFKGGVKGFIEFAKWAENVRFNVAQLGNMIEKIQTGGLEGVIQQSAQLQVLGGGFAMNADPLRMAFNAFQDPESLAKDFYDALKSEGLFDTKTGELTQGIASQMRLRAASEAYGFSYEDARTMIRERTRKENAMSQLRGSNFSEEQRNAIANVAQRDKEGNWFVNTLQGKKGLNELKPADLEKLLTNETDKDLVAYAKETLSLTQIISSAAQKVDSILGGETFDDLVKTVQTTTTETVNAFTANMKSVGEAIKTVHDQSVKATQEQLGKLGSLNTDIQAAYQTQAEANKKVGDIYKLLEAKYGEVLEKQEKNAIKTAASEYYKQFKKDNPAMDYGMRGPQTAEEKKAFNEYRLKSSLAEEAYSAGMAGRVDYFKNGGKEGLTGRQSTSNVKDYQKRLGLSDDEIVAMRKEIQEQIYPEVKDITEVEAEPAKDAIASAGGTPMAVAAKDITSIHDGLALADKRDSAVFAKTGGPFDTLFNGIFNRINAVYAALGMDNNTRLGRMMPIAMKTINEMPREMGIGERMREMASNGRRDESPVRFEPLKVEMSGRLELSSGGKSVDIMNELQNNPLLVREIARMISDSLSSKFYGGKSRMNPGQNTYFK